MPLYDYRCKRCGRVEADVVCAYDDPPPEVDDDCIAGAEVEGGGLEKHDFERMACAGSWRWKGDYNNEGRGGWTRQGDFMSRKVDSKPKRMYPTARRSR